MNPSEQAIKNRSLAADNGGTLPGDSTTPGFAPSSDPSQFDQFLGPQSIMDTYNSAKSLTTKTGTDAAARINSQYGTGVSDTNISDTKDLTTKLDNGGFAQMPVALNYLQMAHDKRIRDLTAQKNEALASNDANTSKALSDLIVNEQTAMSNAKTTFLSNFFNTQANTRANTATDISKAQEARAASGFETPEQIRQRNLDIALKTTQQQGVLSLAQSAPDANILPTDDYATAVQKFKDSPSFKRNVSQGLATIASTNAQAGAASAQADAAAAQAANTRALTGLMTGGSGNVETDAQGLANGTMSAEDLQTKYGGNSATSYLIPQIISLAQSKYGYDLNKENLTQAGKKNLNSASTGGNILSAGTAALYNIFSTPPSKSLSPSTSNEAYQSYLKAIGK